MTQPAQSSDYCAKCHLMILQPNVNYGINPDAVCKCPSAPAQRAAQPQEVPAPRTYDMGSCVRHQFVSYGNPLSGIAEKDAAQEVPAEQRHGIVKVGPNYRKCLCGLEFGGAGAEESYEAHAQPASAAKPRGCDAETIMRFRKMLDRIGIHGYYSEMQKEFGVDDVPVPAQPPEQRALCPSCRASDNEPFTDANGVAMRACGRCMIQWRAAQPASAAQPPKETK